MNSRKGPSFVDVSKKLLLGTGNDGTAKQICDLLASNGFPRVFVIFFSDNIDLILGSVDTLQGVDVYLDSILDRNMEMPPLKQLLLSLGIDHELLNSFAEKKYYFLSMLYWIERFKDSENSKFIVEYCFFLRKILHTKGNKKLIDLYDNDFFDVLEMGFIELLAYIVLNIVINLPKENDFGNIKKDKILSKASKTLTEKILNLFRKYLVLNKECVLSIVGEDENVREMFDGNMDELKSFDINNYYNRYCKFRLELIHDAVRMFSVYLYERLEKTESNADDGFDFFEVYVQGVVELFENFMSVDDVQGFMDFVKKEMKVCIESRQRSVSMPILERKPDAKPDKKIELKVSAFPVKGEGKKGKRLERYLSKQIKEGGEVRLSNLRDYLGSDVFKANRNKIRIWLDDKKISYINK